MPALLLALLGRLLLAQLAVSCALGALVVAGALVEGHAPDPERLRTLALAGGGALGATWVLVGFRREAGDVALAALGVAPRWVVGVVLLGGLPALALAGGGPAPTPGLVADGALHLPTGTVRWIDGVAARDDLPGDLARFPGLPAPPPPAPPAGLPAAVGLAALRLTALAVALAWLSRRDGRPDQPAALLAGALATLPGLLPLL